MEVRWRESPGSQPPLFFSSDFFSFKIFHLLFWPPWVFIVACGLSLVHVLLIVMASLVVELGLSSCGTWAQLPYGMWDLPGPGVKPVFLALQGGFLTTRPPGKPLSFPEENKKTCQASVGSSVLSRHNKDLEWQTLKPLACHTRDSSRVLDRPCFSS